MMPAEAPGQWAGLLPFSGISPLLPCLGQHREKVRKRELWSPSNERTQWLSVSVSTAILHQVPILPSHGSLPAAQGAADHGCPQFPVARPENQGFGGASATSFSLPRFPNRAVNKTEMQSAGAVSLSVAASLSHTPGRPRRKAACMTSSVRPTAGASP